MRAAAHEAAVVYDTGTAAGRAARRTALSEAARAAAAAAEAARAEAEAAGERVAPTTLDDFWWTQGMLTGESECGWRPPASSIVALVLTEFVQSDYARQVFNCARVGGTDYGQIRGMFESVRLRGGILELTFTKACQNVEGLTERLAAYLRAKVPQISAIHQMHRDGMNIL